MPDIFDLEALKITPPEFPSETANPGCNVDLTDLPGLYVPSPFTRRTHSRTHIRRKTNGSLEASKYDLSENKLPKIDENERKATSQASKLALSGDESLTTVEEERRAHKRSRRRRKHRERRQRKATTAPAIENSPFQDEPYSLHMPPPSQLPHYSQAPFSGPPHVIAEMNAEERQQLFKNSKLSQLDYHDRLAAVGIKTVYQRSPPGEPLSYNIALNSLQRMVLYDLQKELVGIVRDIVQKQEVISSSMETARQLLGKYTAAIGDYDFMTESLARTTAADEKDLFLITTRDILGFCLLKDQQLIPTGDQLKVPDRGTYGNHRVVLPGSSRNAHAQTIQLSQFLERLSMGVCGGVALIAPMLLMVLHEDQATALATTSVATIPFALGLSLFGKGLRGQEVLGAVAAYAAVLVVFVGASSS